MRKSTAEDTAVAQADDVEFIYHLAVGELELLSDICRGAVLWADLAGGWIAQLRTEYCPPLGVHLGVGIRIQNRVRADWVSTYLLQAARNGNGTM